MSLLNEVELKFVSDYGKDKIDASKLNVSNYISTDNLIAEKGGAVDSEYLPKSGRVSKYNIGDSLVSNIRPYFKKILFAKEIGGCSNDIIVFKPKVDKIDPKYLYYQLSKDDFFDFMMAGANGTKMPRGNKKSIPDYKLSLPVISAQRKIASILSAYDDLIENNLKRIKLLEEIAQRTYEEWFVKFRINGEQLPVDENTGLPVGWELTELKEMGEVITGKTPTTTNEKFFGYEIPFVKTPDMTGVTYVIGTSQNLSKLGADSQKNRFLPKNSLMVSCIGSAGVVSLSSAICQTNQQINSIIFKDELYTFYVYCFSKSLKPILEALGSNGATMTNVNKGKFEKIKIPLPDLNYIKTFHNISASLFESILNLQYQNQKLKESKDILLPRLMNGTIKVSES